MLHKSLGYAIVGDVYLETCNMYPLCTLFTLHTLMTCGRECATMMTTFQSKDGTKSNNGAQEILQLNFLLQNSLLPLQSKL
jgi:hypothetical protein